MLRTAVAAVGIIALFSPLLNGQVPQLINYQGRVFVGATTFDGDGQFKFALVNGAGTTAYWTNDGTHPDGAEPAASVTLPVSHGLYSVLLGDSSLAHMIAIPNAVFENSDVRLRVWFDDGTHGSQLLSPDQRFAAVGYAMMTANVPDGTITSAKILPGAVGAPQLAPDAIAINLNNSGQSGVGSGGIILSETENPALVSAGYVRIAVTTVGDTWRTRSNAGAPSPRYSHTAVWTGSEMVVWGGTPNELTFFNDGSRFNPVANTWTPIAAVGAPTARRWHTAVWTGSEMIIWGGGAYDSTTGYTSFNTGGRYNPVSDSWTATATTAAPSGRINHTAIWTGAQMVVWGGSGATLPNTGGRYNPVTDSWVATATTAAPPGRINHTAIWTGTQMVIWGGYGDGGALGDGGRYNPATNVWSTISATAAPAVRYEHTAIWTGSEMTVWGGFNGTTNLNTGGRYNPVANSWSATSLVEAPSPRASHRAIWTGTEMVAWGGYDGAYLNTGGRYNPAANTWRPISMTDAPSPRVFPAAVWTGAEMIVYGGFDGSALSGAFSYIPNKTMILYQRP